MKKKNIIYFLCLNIVFASFLGCGAMATLFHGPEPEEEDPVFIVDFDANGATGTAPSERTVPGGTMITMPGEGGLTRGGNVFTGWNVSKSGGGTTYPPESSYTVTADQTFYAQWTDPAQVYTVTYDKNGASGAPPSQQKVVQNGSIIVAGSGNLANANKTFAGWNTVANGTGTTYNTGDTLVVSANMTLYAQWLDPDVPRCTITYHANGADGTAPATQTVNRGSSITLPGAGGLAYSGKTFNGWNTAANGSGTSYKAGAALVVSANMTLYAQWGSPQYTVTYDSNGASGTAPAAQKVNGVSSITLPGAGGLTYSGKTFNGWNTAADGTGTNYNAGASLAVSADITLYAQWGDPQYTVKYDSNGATSGTAPAAQRVNKGSGITLPGSGGLANGGKIFTGWNTVANGTGAAYAEGATYTVNADTTFYAQWSTEPTVPPGSTLAEQLAYIGTQFDNGASYDITVDADESLVPTTVMTGGKNVTITLRSPSAGDIKTVSLSTSTGYLFTVSANITLKLQNIKIQGSVSNNVALVRVGSGGTMILDTGGEITGNTNGSGYRGGGIFVDGGMVIMLNGKISSNTMQRSDGTGGGVHIAASGRFTMHGGTISGNVTTIYNSARGGGVYIATGGYFAKTPLEAGGPSGIIYGSDAGEGLANVAGGGGQAVYYASGEKKRNTTLGGFDEISTDNVNIGWE